VEDWFKMAWTIGVSAAGIAFTASLAELVEAHTTVLAVSTLYGARPVLSGSIFAVVSIFMVGVFFQMILGVLPSNMTEILPAMLVLLFGLGRLRTAVLQIADVLPSRDERAQFASALAQLVASTERQDAQPDLFAVAAVFRAIFIRGLDIAFIVVAFGASHDLWGPVFGGGLAGGVLVIAVAAVVRRPLFQIPNNILRFGVGVLLSAFGVFWTGQSLGIEWPAPDQVFALLACLFLATGLLAINFGKHFMEARGN